MTGKQLKKIRDDRKQTLREMADSIKDVSHTTIARWEANDEVIPSWVEERIIGSITVRLPLSDLASLLELARSTNQSAEALISDALKEFATKLLPADADKITPFREEYPDERKIADPPGEYNAGEPGSAE